MSDNATDMLAALEKISRSLDAEASSHRCSCTHPCDDYFVWPGPCGARAAECFRNIKVIADVAITEATKTPPAKPTLAQCQCTCPSHFREYDEHGAGHCRSCDAEWPAVLPPSASISKAGE